MDSRIIDMTAPEWAGKTGRWKVLKAAPSRKGYWLCRCECGTESEIEGKSLRKGANGGTTQCVRCADKNRAQPFTPAKAESLKRARAAALLGRPRRPRQISAKALGDILDAAEREAWDAARLLTELRGLIAEGAE